MRVRRSSLFPTPSTRPPGRAAAGACGAAARPPIPPLLVALVVLLIAGWAAPVLLRTGLLAAPTPAGAAVEHGDGFEATVDGYRGWFGSYHLEGIGTAWCVDHGIAAPDAALGYQPTDLAEHAPDTRRALAWAVGRYGPSADRVGAAALMLVLHDLMGATYPSGPLDVDALTPDALGGFDGQEAAVLERARAMKADAVEHAGYVGALAFDVDAPAVLAGRPGTLSARLHDADGRGVSGAVLHPAVTGALLSEPVDVVSDADGRASWSFAAGAGANQFDFALDLPAPDVEAFQPTAGPAQRVIRPANASVAAGTGFVGVVPHSLTIVKTGDAQPDLPVAGARFRVADASTGVVIAETVVGADGRATAVEVVPGRYTITEVAAPPGYDAAGPWTVDVADADVTLEAHDMAQRGRLVLEKVDAITGAPVTGARFRVERATAAGAGGSVVDATAPLLPGHYLVTEVTAPPGYRLATEPVPVDVIAGREVRARVGDVAFASVSFEKHPALAGAQFTVLRSPEAAGATPGPVVGQCTTDGGGRCALVADALDAGAPYCWEETASPPGWSRAAGGCFTAGAAGSSSVITVDEQPVPAPAVPSPPPSPAAPAPPAPTPAVIEAAAPVVRPAPASAVTPLVAPELPRTGFPAAAVAAAGIGLVGWGLVLLGTVGRRRPRPPGSVNLSQSL